MVDFKKRKKSNAGLKRYESDKWWLNECSVLSLIFICLLQKCALTSFILLILHIICVLCGKVFSFTRKRISRAQSLTWEFVESLYSPVDIIATAPKISPQLTVNLVLLCCCGVSRIKMALLVQRFYASLEQHIILGGRPTASWHQGVWAGYDMHILLFRCCGRLHTWLGSASHSKLRVISHRRICSACLDLTVAKPMLCSSGTITSVVFSSLIFSEIENCFSLLSSLVCFSGLFVHKSSTLFQRINFFCLNSF